MREHTKRREVIYFKIRFSVKISGGYLTQLIVGVGVKKEQIGRELLIWRHFDNVTDLDVFPLEFFESAVS